MSQILYRVFDPITKKYIRKINSGNYYSSADIVQSTQENTVLTDKQVAGIYQSVMALQLNRQNVLHDIKLLKKKPKNAHNGQTVSDERALQQANARLRRVNEVIKIVNRAIIQECKIESVENSANLEKTKGLLFKSTMKKHIKNSIDNTYDKGLTDWYIKHVNSKRRNKVNPYCILRSSHYHNNVHKEIQEMLISLGKLGIKAKRLSYWSDDILIFKEEDFNLFKLSNKNENYQKEVLFSDIQKIEKKARRDVVKQFKNLAV